MIMPYINSDGIADNRPYRTIADGRLLWAWENGYENKKMTKKKKKDTKNYCGFCNRDITNRIYVVKNKDSPPKILPIPFHKPPLTFVSIFTLEDIHAIPPDSV